MLFEKEDVTRMSLKQGEMVFKQNAEGDGIYIVEHGAINIVKLVDGEQVNLAILRDGEMFGEMAVIDGSKRMASAIALKNSTVIKVGKELLEHKLRNTDSFIRALLNILVGSLRDVHRVYMTRPRSINDHINALAFHVHGFRKTLDSVNDQNLVLDGHKYADILEANVKSMRKTFKGYRDKREDIFSGGGNG